MNLTNSNKKINITGRLIKNGIQIKFNNQNYRIIYPQDIWNALDPSLRPVLLDNLTFLTTHYLPLVLKKGGVFYSTHLPFLESHAFKSFILGSPSSAAQDIIKTSDLIRDYINLEFTFQSYSIRLPSPSIKLKSSSQPSAIILFSSGKESLLTLALCLKLGIKPILLYIPEHSCLFESKHKIRLLEEIKKKLNLTTHILIHETAWLRDHRHLGLKKEFALGWDNLLLEYLCLALPFVYYYQTEYIFFGNEYSTDWYTIDEEGFKNIYAYDQTAEWTQQMDAVSRLFTRGFTKTASLVAGLNEIAIVKILHVHFPEIAQFQMSCFADNEKGEKNRWCCACSKCARIYAFLKAFNIDIKKLGFKEEMFTLKHKKYFCIFEGKKIEGYDYLEVGKEEQLLAFHLAARYLPQNKLIKEFKKIYYPQLRLKEKELIQKYFTVYDSIAVPSEFKKTLNKILNQYLADIPTLLFHPPKKKKEKEKVTLKD